MEEDDASPFSLSDSNYTVSSSSSIGSQYHAWVTAAVNNSTSLTTSNNNGNGSGLPTHFSPVSPAGHGMYADHLGLPSAQSAVDVLSIRMVDYHSSPNRLNQDDGYPLETGGESSSRHQVGQAEYHDHLLSSDRHMTLDTYHHLSAPSSSVTSSQGQDRLGQSSYRANHERLGQDDYHAGQQSGRTQGTYHSSSQQASRLSQSVDRLGQGLDRLGQSLERLGQAAEYPQQDRLAQGDFHQPTDRGGQPEYHISPGSDRLSHLDYGGQGESRMGALCKQEYLGDRLGQQSGLYAPGQAGDNRLGGQTDYHSAQVDLDAVSMHPDFDRRHLDISLLSKDLVEAGQRAAAMDYLGSQSSRDSLASIVGLQRELDLSVGQSVSPQQRNTQTNLATASYSIDPSALPRDLSPYSQRDLDRAMITATDMVASQTSDSNIGSITGRGASLSTAITLHPQDLVGINLSAASRDLLEVTSMARSGSGRDDTGRGRDVIHRPRDIQRALEVLGSLDNTDSVDLTLSGSSGSKTSRSFASVSRQSTSKRQLSESTASQASDVRLQNSVPTVSTGVGSNTAQIFFPLLSARDPLIQAGAPDDTVLPGSSRHGMSSGDFSRQQTNGMSRLRHGLATPYSDLNAHSSVLTSNVSVPMPTYKVQWQSGGETYTAHGDHIVCTDALNSSRERMYEMMKQQQFCDAVVGTSLHSIKVHKAVLCSASVYLCGVLSQTCMGKSGGRVLTAQFQADIPASSLTAFVDYMYLGRLKMSLKSARDLNVIARCLHMESLKKSSGDILSAMGVTSSDMDLYSIPELILLETLVDKFDKACTASFSPSVPLTPSMRDMAVITETVPPLATAIGSCQTDLITEDRECASCKRGIRLPALGAQPILENQELLNSIIIESGFSSKDSDSSKKPHTAVQIVSAPSPTYPAAQKLPTYFSSGSLPFWTRLSSGTMLTAAATNNGSKDAGVHSSVMSMARVRHKKHLASQAMSAVNGAGAGVIVSSAPSTPHTQIESPYMSISPSLAPQLQGLVIDHKAKSASTVGNSETVTLSHVSPDFVGQKKSIDSTEKKSLRDYCPTLPPNCLSSFVLSSPSPDETSIGALCLAPAFLPSSASSMSTAGRVGKHRKRASTPALNNSSSSPSPLLPGQNPRPVHHSYGTRAASRTPTRSVDSTVNVAAHQSVKTQVTASDDAEAGHLKQNASDNTDAQTLMAKHRGRTKKGRIAAALSEDFKKAAKANDSVSLAEAALTKDLLAVSLCNSEQASGLLSTASCSQGIGVPSDAAILSGNTAVITDIKSSAPRAYRKRLIQSVVSSQTQVKKQAAEDKDIKAVSGEACLESSSTVFIDQQNQLLHEIVNNLPTKGDDFDAHVSSLEHAKEIMFHSPVPSKRKKKGKARRMLLSSSAGSSAVRVRAPPKKRAKMELELEKLLQEEMEEEEEEEDARGVTFSSGPGLSAAKHEEPTGKTGETEKALKSSSKKRIRIPSAKPGRLYSWVKIDQLSPLLMELTNLASKVAGEKGECTYTCCLCLNQFLMPKRCLIHVISRHKVAETEVILNIILQKKQELQADGDTGVIMPAIDSNPFGNPVCEFCGYRSRENNMNYLHYHKYFKHGVPLPKGWTAYTCDICGKETFTKFQLKDHMRTHTEKTPFVCEHCGDGFQTRSNLHSHVLHRHKEEKKHACSYCQRTFKTRTQVAVHERTHTGMKPFACSKCPYRSTTRGNMRLHYVKKHKMDSAEVQEIMDAMKPDFDLSLKLASLQHTCMKLNNASTGKEDDSMGTSLPQTVTKSKMSLESKKEDGLDDELETNLPQAAKKSTRSRKSRKNRNDCKTTATADGSSDAQLFPVSAVFTDGSLPIKEEDTKATATTCTSTLEMLLRGASNQDGLTSDGTQEANRSSHGGGVKSSVILTSEGNSQLVTFQAAGGFTTAAAVGMCSNGDATTMTFIPQGLETMLQHQVASTASHIGGGTMAMSAVTSATPTTIILPDNFLQLHRAGHHPHPQQQQHGQPILYSSHPRQGHHPHLTQPFAGFVVGTGMVQTLHSLAADFVLHSGEDGGAGAGMVDLTDMGVGVMTVGQQPLGQGELSLLQSGAALDIRAGIVGVRGDDAGGDLSLQQQQEDAFTKEEEEGDDSATGSGRGVRDQLYMQHSPISPAASVPSPSPSSMYVAVTPTQTNSDSEPVQMLDPSQHVQSLQHYDTSLLQAYYQGQLYAQTYG